MFRLLSFLFVLMITTPTEALEWVSSSVAHNDGTYIIQAELHLDAPRERVMARITDYDKLAALNPLVRETKTLPHQSSWNRTRVRVTYEACFFFFCKVLISMQDIYRTPRGLRVSVRSADGSFPMGNALWDLQRAGGDGGRTRARFSSRLNPDFWIPPIIGPFLVKRRLREAMAISFPLLEAWAMETTGSAP